MAVRYHRLGIRSRFGAYGIQLVITGPIAAASASMIPLARPGCFPRIPPFRRADRCMRRPPLPPAPRVLARGPANDLSVGRVHENARR